MDEEIMLNIEFDSAIQVYNDMVQIQIDKKLKVFDLSKLIYSEHFKIRFQQDCYVEALEKHIKLYKKNKCLTFI